MTTLTLDFDFVVVPRLQFSFSFQKLDDDDANEANDVFVKQDATVFNFMILFGMDNYRGEAVEA